MPRSLLDKIWDAHLVEAESLDRPGLLYVDLHLVHEVTSPQAFDGLRERGLPVRRPDRTFATLDHSTPTLNLPGGEPAFADPAAKAQVEALEQNCREFGVPIFGYGSDRRGIVHVIGPELGLSRPGSVIVCGDSHTATHGALGALAFGIGTTEVEHVLATQCLLQRKPKNLRIRVDGRLAPGVSAKDLVLAILARMGSGGGRGHVIEYQGDAIRALDMESRFTVCNMSIEMGARAGMIAPDQTTLDWLKGRPFAPASEGWDAYAARVMAMASDDGAAFDTSVELDASEVAPMITWGTEPGKGIAIDQPVPLPASPDDRRALDYMQFEAGRPLLGECINRVFLGSCTNGRLSDLRHAARLLAGRRVAGGVHMLISPGSDQVKQAAEAEGLDAVFKRAGADWREPGCSMCVGLNGDRAAPGELVVSTSNRNFPGRQGPGVRTVLASPGTAAASAIAGCLADPRSLATEALHD